MVLGAILWQRRAFLRHYAALHRPHGHLRTHLASFPDARVVVGVRDPVDRLQSSFKLWYRITRSRRIEDYQKYLLDDLHTQLLIANRAEWLAERYGKRLIFVRHEDVKRDAVGTAQKLLTALGLSDR
jgi:hypothetical protein